MAEIVSYERVKDLERMLSKAYTEIDAQYLIRDGIRVKLGLSNKDFYQFIDSIAKDAHFEASSHDPFRRFKDIAAIMGHLLKTDKISGDVYATTLVEEVIKICNHSVEEARNYDDNETQEALNGKLF